MSCMFFWYSGSSASISAMPLLLSIMGFESVSEIIGNELVKIVSEMIDKK